ncbi:MAG: biotin-dependent carboxyltransferase family protein [Gemmobacter sp.]
MALTVLSAGPAVTIQDMGRPGWLAQGLSRGGAMDRLALVEAAALLGQSETLAALEIPGSFLALRVERAARLALTGAPMRATCNGAPLAWHATHAVPAGARVEVAAPTGGFGYLSFGGGIEAPMILGSRSAHLAAGIGRPVAAGDTLPLGQDPGGRIGQRLAVPDRFSGGRIRFADGPQTRRFEPETLERFQATSFTRDARGNRMGLRLTGGSFAVAEGLSILSDAVLPGDIQITGDGTPCVLLAECQTSGGYPRIGRILPCDLPRLVQAPTGAELVFERIDAAAALMLERAEAERRARLRMGILPLIRDPAAIPDLLSYQLVGGVTRGDELERDA